MKRLAILAGILIVAMVPAREVRFRHERAQVTNDAGTQGNVSHGNLPDSGDEIGWTLPDGFEAGVYRVYILGRTGDRGEGLSFVDQYLLTAPERAYAEGAGPHDIGFLWDRESPPRIRSEGDGYKVFEGEMAAKELLYLRAGDQIRVRNTGRWGMVWELILRSAPADARAEASLQTDVPASMFASEKAELPARVTNWGEGPANWQLRLEVTDLAGERVSRQSRRIAIGARQSVPVTFEVERRRYGPLWADLIIEGDGEERARATQAFCFSPAPDPAEVSADSPFGIHKSDLGEWPAIGAKWVRLWDTGDTWNRYEKKRGQIDWAELDAKVEQAQRRGVKILYVFAYTPTWASARPDEAHYTGGGARAEPADIQDWRNFVHAVVERYKDRVAAFEIWNEPNAGFFTGTTDAYAELLQAAYEEAKAANPDCTILGISGTGGYLDWMEEVFKRGGLDYMDVVSIHTYTTPRSPEQANVLGRIQSTRKLIEKYGGNQPIWNTEVGIWQPSRQHCRPMTEKQIVQRAPEETKPDWKAGWPYRPISEMKAARHCVRMYTLAMAGGVQKLFWYAWYTSGMPMYTTGNAPRLMTIAYAAMTDVLDDAEFVRRMTLGTSDINICVFDRPRGPVAVVWSTQDNGRQIAFDAEKPPGLRDIWSNPAEGGGTVVNLTPSPQYVEGLSLQELATARLSGRELVFQAVSAEITADVGEENVKEHTSPPHHGDRRVMGLPDAGDQITWVLHSISAGVYRIEVDGFCGYEKPANHIAKYVLRVRNLAQEQARTLELQADPDRPPQKVRENRYYGPMVGTEPVALRPGARVSIHKSADWGFIGPLTLTKVREISGKAPVPCRRIRVQPTIDGDLSDWPDLAPLAINARKQAVIGVADAFASTAEYDSWRGPEDLSAEVLTAWDAEGVWVGVRVTDDAIHGQAERAPWSGDCVEIFLDLRGPDELGSSVMGEGVHQVFCPAPAAQPADAYPASGDVPEGSRFAASRVSDGWVLEAYMPLRGIGFAWRQGRKLGFDIAVDDADNDPAEAAVRKAQLVWRGTANNFEDPSAYGMLQLVE